MPPRKRSTAAAPAETPDAGVEAAPLTPDTGEPELAGPVESEPVPLTPPGDNDESESGKGVEGGPVVDDEPVTDAAPLAPPAPPAPEPEPEDDKAAPPAPPAVMGQEQAPNVVLQDGSRPDPDTLFADPGRRHSYVIVTQRLLEQFYYGHTTTPTRRLLYRAGARVSRAEADRIRQALASSRPV